MSTGTSLAKAPFEIYTLAHVSRMGGPTAKYAPRAGLGLGDVFG
jgi:hypothetical protein